jgi:hypothetical protein
VTVVLFSILAFTVSGSAGSLMKHCVIIWHQAKDTGPEWPWLMWEQSFQLSGAESTELRSFSGPSELGIAHMQFCSFPERWMHLCKGSSYLCFPRSVWASYNTKVCFTWKPVLNKCLCMMWHLLLPGVLSHSDLYQSAFYQVIRWNLQLSDFIFPCRNNFAYIHSFRWHLETSKLAIEGCHR